MDYGGGLSTDKARLSARAHQRQLPNKRGQDAMRLRVSSPQQQAQA